MWSRFNEQIASEAGVLFFIASDAGTKGEECQTFPVQILFMTCAGRDKNIQMNGMHHQYDHTVSIL